MCYIHGFKILNISKMTPVMLRTFSKTHTHTQILFHFSNSYCNIPVGGRGGIKSECKICMEKLLMQVREKKS